MSSFVSVGVVRCMAPGSPTRLKIRSTVDGIPGLLELADGRLAATDRELTPEERELYLG